jgi:uncharacterized protein YcbK (DUF882 family)
MEVIMYRLLCALFLFAVTIQPDASGQPLNSNAFDKQSYGIRQPTLNSERYDEEFVAAATKVTGYMLQRRARALSLPSSNRPGRLATRTIIPKLKGTSVVRGTPALRAGVEKTVSKAHKTGWKKSAREEAMRTVLPASRGRANHAPGLRAPAMVVTYQSGLSLPIVKGPDGKGQEHYDPTGSGNPLLDTSGAYRSQKLSDNFLVNEVARNGKKSFDIARIDPRLIVCLQAIRDVVGQPVMINSGYRSFWYNIEIYKEKHQKPTRSQHISGKASDIKIGSMTGLDIGKAAIDACGLNVAVGLGPRYAHIDVRGTPATWIYDGVPRQQYAELEGYRTSRRVAHKGRTRRPRRGSLS